MVSPTVTSLATCSSAASIPANLEATKKMGISSDVRETVVLLGSTLHKDGSVLGGVLKIAFLFGIFNMEFEGPKTLAIALVVSLLVGTVMGAIPGGGMIGEMLIVSLYGFPPEALPIIAAISTIIDPPATMLNVTADNACAVMTARLVEGKNWIKNKFA
jgi:Na+/H+-dicarboxylate symporter